MRNVLLRSFIWRDMYLRIFILRYKKETNFVQEY